MNNSCFTGKVYNMRTFQANGEDAVNFTLGLYDGKHSDFIRCAAFGKIAQVILKYVRNKDRIGITAKVRTRTYETGGVKREAVTFHVTGLDLLEPKPERERKPLKKEETPPLPKANPNVAEPDEELPF